MRFLVTDDSVTMRRIIANILVRLGYPDVLHASNGREALDRLAAEPVDVVITDWYMPELSGLDFVKAVRNSPATRHIPIVIVTANAASDDIHDALELGVKSYILKPFTVETMKDKIGALISQIEMGGADTEAAVAGATMDEPVAAKPVGTETVSAESPLEVQAEPTAAV